MKLLCFQAGGLGDIKYPLLADFNKTTAKSYGVLLEKEGIPLRGLFIIDSKVSQFFDQNQF